MIYAIAPSPLTRRTDLGRHRRRPDLAHARRGRALDERHAAGAAAAGRRSASSSRRTSIRTPPTPRSTATASTTCKPYIYRTHDGGRSLAADRRRHPRRRPNSSTSCARTRCGAACSTPAPSGACTSRSTTATTGSRCRPNLPATSVRDIDVHGDDLVIATHGRGFWVLDDVVAAARARGQCRRPAFSSFRSATAVRLQRAGFTGTPMPKDEPLAANPPFGGDDRLRASGRTSPDRCEIAIYDPAGSAGEPRSAAAIRSSRSTSSTLAVAPEWVVSRQAAARRRPGHHRFVWDLHYAKPTGLKDDGCIGRRLGAAGTLHRRARRRRPAPCASRLTSSPIRA